VDFREAELFVAGRLPFDEVAFFVAILSLLKVSYESIVTHFLIVLQYSHGDYR
jgi:hypothetical protein